MNTSCTWRSGWIAAMAGVLPLWVGLGCAGVNGNRDNLGPTPRLMMDPGLADQARRWYRQWPDEPDRVGPTSVHAVGLIAASERSGQRAYARLIGRLALTTEDFELVRLDGPIRIVLIARPDQPEERVIGGWSLTAAEAGEHFRYGRLPSYRLDLWWPRIEGTSTYRIMLRWESPDGRARQTTEISFEDAFSHETRTTQPVP